MGLKMTKRESAIITAMTGISFGERELFSEFHQYVEEKFGHPVFTHEMAEKKFWEQLKKLAMPDFIELAKNIDGVTMTEKEMESNDLKEGDIVQLNPETVGNKMFAACLMIVTEIKSWGAQGYVQALGENGNPGGQAYYRAHHDEMVKVGHAEWVVA